MRARRQTARSRDEANEPQGAPPSRPVRPRRHAPVAVPLVVLSLVALAALAVVVDQQMGRIEAVLLEHGAPARTAVHDIQVGLALETAGTRGYLLTGDTIYASAHQEARQRRREATARLGGVAGGMDDDIDALIASLKERLVPADAALDSLFAGLIPRQDYRARLPAQQGRLEAVTTTVTAIGDAVNDHMYARFRDVRRGGRISLMLTLLLVAATMAAGTQVARLGLSYRRLAVTEHAAREASEAAREEAERSKAALERIAESRARLIRGFTHDVKNPLGAAAAYLGLLEMGAMTPDDAIQRVRRTLDSALKLIDDSLLVARAEKGELEVHREPFDLGAIARQAVEDARALARAKRLDLHAEIPDTLPFLNSDPRRVRQVLDNLISNAIKYTDSGA